MDPIKQKQIQDLQAQIKAIKAEGKSADNPKLAKLEAELAKLINPKGNDAGEMGLRVQRAQKAASDYCEYQAEKGQSVAKDIKSCTEETTRSIMSCEETNEKYFHDPQEQAEKQCFEWKAKINKPTKEMEKTATEYCQYTLEEEPEKKAPEEVAECSIKTAQELADCENSINDPKNAREICIKHNAQILRPTKNEQKAAAEFCKDTSGDNASCIKSEAKSIAICRDIDIDVYHTPQEVAENKCIKESKEKGKRIKARNDQEKDIIDRIKNLKEQIQRERFREEPSEDRIKRERLRDPSYEES